MQQPDIQMSPYVIPGIRRINPVINTPEQVKKLVTLAEQHYSLPEGSVFTKGPTGKTKRVIAGISTAYIRISIIYLVRSVYSMHCTDLARALQVHHTTVIDGERRARNFIRMKDRWFTRYLDSIQFLAYSASLTV